MPVKRYSVLHTSGELLQLRVLGLGLLQDGDVGIGVFPEGHGVFVGGAGGLDAGGIGTSRGSRL
jgi:hypothetical protein